MWHILMNIGRNDNFRNASNKTKQENNHGVQHMVRSVIYMNSDLISLLEEVILEQKQI
jgi:hypothetical protein